MPNIKKSKVDYSAESAVIPFTKEGQKVFDVEFRVSNNDVAFRYTVYPKKDILCCVVQQEATGFVLPEGTTTFLCPQSTPMGGFARTSPSYETPYTVAIRWEKMVGEKDTHFLVYLKILTKVGC